MISVRISKLEEIGIAAEQFISAIADKKAFAFYGKMGAGKTTFIKEICSQMGVNSDVTSPTFSIVNEYISEKYGMIYHFDLYRIKNIKELLDIGFEEYISSESIIFMEWPEIAENILADNLCKVNIMVLDNDERLISF
jgi:tRNA threonylcarbamoyladenosine biosynthesis protein TsaE